MQMSMEASAGFHFHVHFRPDWCAIRPVQIRRARALGLVISDAGDELKPSATGMTLTGFQLAGLRKGSRRFDVLDYDAESMQTTIHQAGVFEEAAAFSFGLADGGRRLGYASDDGLRARLAVSIWLRDGSLLLERAESSDSRIARSEVVSAFDLWTALSELWRGSLGVDDAVTIAAPADRPVSAPAPSWAPGFRVMARFDENGTVRATLRSERLNVLAAVQPMIRDELDGS
jgi:hypothetical protein